MSVDGYHPDELAAIIDVANRYRLTGEEAEEFLEQVGYYEK